MTTSLPIRQNTHFRCRRCKCQYNLFTTTCGRLYCYKCKDKYINKCNCNTFFKLMQNNDIIFKNVYDCEDKHSRVIEYRKKPHDKVYVLEFKEVFFIFVGVVVVVYLLYKLQTLEPMYDDWKDVHNNL